MWIWLSIQPFINPVAYAYSITVLCCLMKRANNLSSFRFDMKGSTAPADEKKDVEMKKLLVVSASDMSVMQLTFTFY